jgi:hypothetical protein
MAGRRPTAAIRGTGNTCPAMRLKDWLALLGFDRCLPVRIRLFRPGCGSANLAGPPGAVWTGSASAGGRLAAGVYIIHGHQAGAQHAADHAEVGSQGHGAVAGTIDSENGWPGQGALAENKRREKFWTRLISLPTAPAAAIPGPAAGARSCAQGPHEKGTVGRRAGHHQQPHGAAGGDPRPRGAQAPGERRGCTPTASMCRRAFPSGSTAGRRGAGRPPRRRRSRMKTCGGRSTRGRAPPDQVAVGARPRRPRGKRAGRRAGPARRGRGAQDRQSCRGRTNADS